MNRVFPLVLVAMFAGAPLPAQNRAVTLAEAIRLAERTQPGVIQAQGQVQTAAAQRRRAEEQLKVSVAKLHAGSATRSDSLRSLVTLGNTQLDLIQARTDLATAEANLARLVGEIGRVRAVDDSTFHQVAATVDTQALRSEIEARSPRIQNVLATASVARANVRV